MSEIGYCEHGECENMAGNRLGDEWFCDDHVAYHVGDSVLIDYLVSDPASTKMVFLVAVEAPSLTPSEIAEVLTKSVDVDYLHVRRVDRKTEPELWPPGWDTLPPEVVDELPDEIEPFNPDREQDAYNELIREQEQMVRAVE